MLFGGMLKPGLHGFKEMKYSKESDVNTDSEWTWYIELHSTAYFGSGFEVNLEVWEM